MVDNKENINEKTKATQKRKRSRKGQNHYEKRSDEIGEYYIGWTFNTNSEFYIDVEDFETIKIYRWREDIDDKGYHKLAAWDNKNRKRIFMHWLICGEHSDHIDRNPLNNRRHNLRRATFKENSRNQSKSTRNTSGIIGVGWYKRYNKWRSHIRTDKQITLGYFENKEDAIRARLKAEIEYFGEFAPQKHLFEKYGIETEQNDCVS